MDSQPVLSIAKHGETSYTFHRSARHPFIVRAVGTILRPVLALFAALCLLAVRPSVLAAQEPSVRDEARRQLARLEVAITPASFLANCIEGRTEIVRLFLDVGMSPDVTDERGQTPLMHAALTGRATIVDRLLAAGARVDHADAHNATPLMYAASEGHGDVMARLLHAGADPNRADSFHGWTSLMYASFEGHADIVGRLIDAGADVDYQDPDRRFSALMYAAFQGFPDVIERLLDAGADVEAANIFGQTALTLASGRGFDQVAARIKEAEGGR